MTDLGIADPQWNFALAIRTALDLHGCFVTEIDERNAQARVDVHWAARQAGRLLGVAVTVEMRPQRGRADFIVTATVRCADPDAVQRSRAEAGLQKLLESVDEARHTPCTPAAIPHPRSVARKATQKRAVHAANGPDIPS